MMAKKKKKVPARPRPGSDSYKRHQESCMAKVAAMRAQYAIMRQELIKKALSASIEVLGQTTDSVVNIEEIYTEYRGRFESERDKVYMFIPKNAYVTKVMKEYNLKNSNITVFQYDGESWHEPARSAVYWNGEWQ